MYSYHHNSSNLPELQQWRSDGAEARAEINLCPSPKPPPNQILQVPSCV